MARSSSHRHTRTPTPASPTSTNNSEEDDDHSSGSTTASNEPSESDGSEQSEEDNSDDEEPVEDGYLTVYNFRGEFYLTRAEGYRKEVCKHIRIAKEIFTRDGYTAYACCFMDDPECKCGHWGKRITPTPVDPHISNFFTPEKAEKAEARRRQHIGLNVTGKHRYPRGLGPQYDVGHIIVGGPVKVAREDIANGKRSVQEAADLSAKLDRQLRAAQKAQDKKKKQTQKNDSNKRGPGGRGHGGSGSSGSAGGQGEHGIAGIPGNPGNPKKRDPRKKHDPRKKPVKPVKPGKPGNPNASAPSNKEEPARTSSGTNGNGKRDRQHEDNGNSSEEDPDAMFRPKKKPARVHPADILKEALGRLGRPGLQYQIKLDFAESLFKDSHIFPENLREEGEGIVRLAQDMEIAARKMQETAKILTGRGKGKETDEPEDPNGDPDRDIYEVLKDALAILRRHDVTVDAKLSFALKLFGDDKIFNATLRSIATSMLDNAGSTHRVLQDNAREVREHDVSECYD